MGMLSDAGAPVAIEPFLIADCLMTGITSVISYGGLIRVTLHCDRPAADGVERLIVARMVMTEADFCASASVAFEAAKKYLSVGAGGLDVSHRAH